MTRPTALQPPPALRAPTMRFWGDRKPPKNRADMFSVRMAAEDDGTAPATVPDTDPPAAGSVATLRLYGPIDSWGGWWGISAQDVSDALDQLGDGVTEIRLRINSPGGESWEAITILNMLRAHQARIVAVVDGLAASAASVIATGVDETVMSPGTQMMVHDPATIAWGNAAAIRKAADFVDSCANAIASVYAESAGGTDAEWRAVMVEEQWYTATEAVSAGLADRVGVVSDAGSTSTAGTSEPELDDLDPEDSFDLSIYNYAGRSHAPAPTEPPAASAGGLHPTKEGATLVDFTDEQIATLRTQVGFPEAADAATITAALSEALAERAEDTTTGTAHVTVQVPEGMQLIENATLQTLTDSATAGRAARDQQLAEHRDQVISQAIRDGKTTVARREHWVTSWAADPAGTEQLLDGLAKGIVPVDELGSGADESAPTDVTESADYQNWSM